MKKFFFQLTLLSLFIPQLVFGIEFETIRTVEEPGFVLVKIFPSEGMHPIEHEAETKKFLENVKATLGGNVFEVLQEGTTVTENQPINIIGKFKKPIKTYLSIEADSAHGPNQYSAFIPLDDKEKANDPLAQYLPELWENLKQRTDDPHKDSGDGISLFPVLLFIIGLFIILWVIRQTYLQRRKERKSAEKIINDMPSSVKKSGIKAMDVPFEIVFKDDEKKKK